MRASGGLAWVIIVMPLLAKSISSIYFGIGRPSSRCNLQWQSVGILLFMRVQWMQF